MLLIVHLLLGYRRLGDLSYYQDDPMGKRLLGLNQLPDASTVSRALSSIDDLSMERVRALCRNLVIERLKKIAIYRVTSLSDKGSAGAPTPAVFDLFPFHGIVLD